VVPLFQLLRYVNHINMYSLYSHVTLIHYYDLKDNYRLAFWGHPPYLFELVYFERSISAKIITKLTASVQLKCGFHSVVM